MLRYGCAIVLLIAGVSCSATPRIYGGQSTTIEQYPSIAQVESTTTGLSWTQSCAGNIINNRFILSAAQCFSGLLFSTSRRRIRVGTARRSSRGSVFRVSRVFNHPTFSSSTNEGDLSIVQLSDALVWSDTIQPVAIVPQNFDLPDNLPVVLAGWGRTRAGIFNANANTLQAVTVEKVNQHFCEEVYTDLEKTVSENMLCTGYPEDGRDSCEGDEGGPVYYIDANNQAFLVGIISWSDSCGVASIPSVNTRIASYTNWIVINAS